MTIEITDLEDVPAERVGENLDVFAARMQEAHPELDLQRGVLRNVVARLHAIVATAEQVQIDRLQSARSLLAIEQQPGLADPAVVDDVLSNFRIDRRAGSTASGEVTVVLSRATGVTIANGAVFEASGRRFRADGLFTARVNEAQLINDNDRLLRQLASGNWAFTISVVAEEPGQGGSIPKDTVLSPASPPPAFVTSFAAEDFTGGADEETNQDLLEKLQIGFATEAPSNRTNMKALLKKLMPDAIDSSLIGFGDVEMIRDQHTIFPTSFPGRVDWYIRTQRRPQRVTETAEATLLEVEGPNESRWQASFGRDIAPGFHEVDLIRPPGAGNTVGSFPILEDTRGTDLPPDDSYLPDVETVEEGTYTRYQTATIVFRDTLKDTSGLTAGAKADYDFTFLVQEGIAEIQDQMNDRERRLHSADVLVKAPIPAFTSVSVTVFKRPGQASPDTDAIQQAIADYVNARPFGTRLHASSLQDVIHNELEPGMSTSPVFLFVRIRRPDGTDLYLRSDEYIEVPREDGTMVSPRTVQYLLREEDVAVSVSSEL